MKNLVVPLGLLALTAAFGSACMGGDEAPRTATDAAAPFLLTITATDYAFEAPDTVPAGFTAVRLVNHGEQPHAAIVEGAGHYIHRDRPDAVAAAIRDVVTAVRAGGPVRIGAADGQRDLSRLDRA